MLKRIILISFCIAIFGLWVAIGGNESIIYSPPDTGAVYLQENTIRAYDIPQAIEPETLGSIMAEPEEEPIIIVDELETGMAYLNKLLSKTKWNAEKLLSTLENAENCNKKKRCIVDINGQLSCGNFCFFKGTFLANCSDLIWGNDRDEMLCAVRMIIDGKGHTFEGWYNSWRKLKLPII
uniref:Uncharacterized protein n=1 Tax=viral metagenome TaxID=1070528 RepID=A0A6H1ZGH4_9ZZZZ